MRITFVLEVENITIHEDISTEIYLISTVCKQTAILQKDFNTTLITRIKIGNKLEHFPKGLNKLPCNAQQVFIVYFFADKLVEVRRISEKLKYDLAFKCDELKEIDQGENMNKLLILKRMSSIADSNPEEVKQVQMHLIISDALVQSRMGKDIPLFQDEPDLTDHLKRITTVFQSSHSLSLSVTRHQATENIICGILTKRLYKPIIRIVQIFADVILENDKLLMCLESSKDTGRRQLVDPKCLFHLVEVDIVVIVGIKAALLSSIDFPVPTVLLSTHSIEKDKDDKPARTFLDSFYRRIFERKPINEAFELAKEDFNSLKKEEWLCCCLHAHNSGCEWDQLLNTIGAVQAHRLFKHRNINETELHPIRKQMQQVLCKHLFQQGKQKGLSEQKGQSKQKEDCLKVCCNIALHKSTSDRIFASQNCKISFPQNETFKPNRLIAEPRCSKPLPRYRPLLLYNVMHQVLSIKKIAIVSCDDRDLSANIIRMAFEYIAQRDSSVLFEQIYDFLEEPPILTQIRSRAVDKGLYSKWYIFYNRTASAQYFEEQLLKLQGLEGGENELFPIFILNTAQAAIGYPDVIKVSGDYDRIEQIMHKIRKLSFGNFPRDYKAAPNSLGILIQQIQAPQTKEIEKKCLAIKETDAKLYNILKFVSQFRQGIYESDINTLLLSVFLDVNSLSEFQKDPSVPFTYIKRGQNIININMHYGYLSHLHTPEDFTLKLRYCYLVMKLHWIILIKNITKNYKLRDDFEAEASDFINEGQIFAISLERKEDTAIINKVYNQLLRDPTGIHVDFQGIQKQTHGFHQSLLSKCLSTSQQTEDAEHYIWSYAVTAYLLYYKIKGEKQFNLTPTFKTFAPNSTQYLSSTILKLQLHTLLKLPFGDIKINPKIKCQALLSKIKAFQQKRRIYLPKADLKQSLNILNSCHILISLITVAFNELGPNESEMFRFMKLRWTKETLDFVFQKVICRFRSTDCDHNIRRQLRKTLNLRNLLSECRCLMEFGRGSRKSNAIVCVKYLEYELQNEIELPEFHPSAEDIYDKPFHPMYLYLSEKSHKSILFDEPNLIVFARAKYFPPPEEKDSCLSFTRKRNLMVNYIKKVLQHKEVKVSYFNLTFEILENLTKNQASKCQLLFLVISVQCIYIDKKYYVMLERGDHINADKQQVSSFVGALTKSNIRFLILIGQNSQIIAQEFINRMPDRIAIAFWNKKNLQKFKKNTQKTTLAYVNNFLIEDAYQIGLDMLMVFLIHEFSSFKRKNYNEESLRQIVESCKNIVCNQLIFDPNIKEAVRSDMAYKVFNRQSVAVPLLKPGKLQDITCRLYSCPHNLIDESYYQNTGKLAILRQILDDFKINKEMDRSFVACLLGQPVTGKSSLLHEICWISQVKNIFPFGIYKFFMKNLRGKPTILQLIKSEQIQALENLLDQDAESGKRKTLLIFEDIEIEDINSNRLFLSKLNPFNLLFSATTNTVLQELKAIYGDRIKQYKMSNIVAAEFKRIAVSYVRHELYANSQKSIKDFADKNINIMKVFNKEELSQPTNLLKVGLQQIKKQLGLSSYEKKYFLEFIERNFKLLLKSLQDYVYKEVIFK